MIGDEPAPWWVPWLMIGFLVLFEVVGVAYAVRQGWL